MKATAVAARPKQPVVALRLLLDGRPLPDQAGICEGQSEAVWEVTLPPGKYALSVLARGPDTSSVSPSVEVDAGSPAKPGNAAALHVLAIGVNAYQEKTLPLDCAAQDAQAIAKACTDTGPGPLFQAVVPHVVVNQDASQACILKELDDLRRRQHAFLRWRGSSSHFPWSSLPGPGRNGRRYSATAASTKV